MNDNEIKKLHPQEGDVICVLIGLDGMLHVACSTSLEKDDCVDVWTTLIISNPD